MSAARALTPCLAALSALAAAVIAAQPCRAQDTAMVAPGTELRLWTRPVGARFSLGRVQHSGMLIAVRNDTLVLRSADLSESYIPRARLTDIMARVPARNTMKGAILGLVTGTLIGAVSGALVEPPEPRDICNNDVLDPQTVQSLEWGFVSGVAGTVVGGVVGYQFKSLKWRRLSWP